MEEKSAARRVLQGEVVGGAARKQRAASRAKSPNAQMICPHCQTRGNVVTERKKMKQGVSGGKATGAILTGGLSLFAVGLSRKQKMTQATCQNCGNEWVF